MAIEMFLLCLLILGRFLGTTKINCLIPACIHSSMIYSKFGFPFIGKSSLGITLDSGSNLVPNPAKGMIACVTIKTFYKLNEYFTS